ncbi:MAG TPA: pyridoxine 5'-phosphate synthase [Candidatus Omnitrophota bacterium]|nr:pyridoxine 5'-phosphate synthase [Candidatus Omnitrophota bacterium]
MKLGVNIDHIATLRQQREAGLIELSQAASICEKNGADSVVVHLREDRRHIQDEDVFVLRRTIKKRLNLEMSVAPDIVRIACKVRPDQATLVPEKRKELTTEGGLDVAGLKKSVFQTVESLKKNGIDCSLFIEPDFKQIKASKESGVKIIELHTGKYAECKDKKSARKALLEIKDSVQYAKSLGLTVCAGHGLDYENVGAIVETGGIHELNIGYSIICRSVFKGLACAVREMKGLII